MDNIYKKLEQDINSLSVEERNEILDKLRNEVDVIDRQLVHLFSKRTLHSVLIGRIKRSMGLPTYAPQREKDVAAKISSYVEEPLSKEAVLRIYERILDESRAIQREEATRESKIPASPQKAKISLKSLLNRKQYMAVIAFFILVLILLYNTFFTANYYPGNGPVRFEIDRGESLSKVAEKLYEMKIIPSKMNFKVAAFVYGAERKIRAARYKIPNGLSYLGLIELFISGNADFLQTITIKDGVPLTWIAAKLHYEAKVDSAEFMNAVSDKNLLDSLGIKAPSMEGYLLPARYNIFERSTPGEIIGIMYKSFNHYFNDSMRNRAKELGYNIHQVLTVASIVDGETNKKDEMPVIAGVYYNRLHTGMRLQADPTVQYLIPGGWRRLTYDDLNINSPYNTYKFAGLPPGPINNPGKNAIQAALYPQNNKYMFFVADGNGGHKFAESYQQHLGLVNQYRKWLKSQGK